MGMKIVRQDTVGGSGDGVQHVGSPYPQKIAKLLNEPIVFNFHDGIPAFEASKRFVLLLNPNIKPFVYLKSLDLDDLGFVCVDPFIVCKEYSVKIPGKDLSILGLKSPEGALVLSMVTVDKDPKKTTCNLLAPIILNTENFTGRQVILEDGFPVRYRIWEGIEVMEKA
jgi:flagellar assembly factor FliW